jgi:uncharacterized protein
MEITGYAEAVLEGISVPVGTSEQDILARAAEKMKRNGIDARSLHFRLYKKSVDARHRDDIRLVCSVLCGTDDGAQAFSADQLARLGAKPYAPGRLELRRGETPLSARPLVVGMGPAGLFCALLLARQGYAPLLIDRGDAVAERTAAVERFVRDGELDTESNIQFGAGGAGTFSDGKLLTRINDARCAFVLDTFRRMGAPEDIVSKAKPHVGTDVLRGVVTRILDEIRSAGGETLFRCRMDGFTGLPDGSWTVHTTRGDIHAGVIVLAPGHSSRDTYGMLIARGAEVIAKPISVGVRIEHRREDIDRLFYGKMAGHPDLGAAEYSFSDTTGERGVYTFCMCPGGQVVAAASEQNMVVVNGMSYHARDGVNSNAAIAVSVQTSDYEPVNGSTAMGAIAFQRRIEAAAFRAGGGNYDVPVETVGDFLAGDRPVHMPGRVQPGYRGGGHFRLSRMGDVLPDFVCRNLSRGLRAFDRKRSGYAMPDAVLSAAETRTSAPVRILRGENFCAIGQPGLYPCGEGAGYAGGITSAAVDGIRVAEAICGKYAPGGF